MTAREISLICDEDKASISRSIDYLEHNGYLTCECKTEKRYKSPIFLTDKGAEISKQIKDKIDNIVELAGIGITEENRINFYKTLFLMLGIINVF
jgi:DNA-binding MarR family transcriptional regulator